MKTVSLVSRICCFVCVALMLAMIILQFVPYWTVGEETVSMEEMIWTCKHHKEITNYWKKNVMKDFTMNSLVGFPIFSLLTGVAGIAFCLIRSKKWSSAIFPLASGYFMIRAMEHPVQQTGAHYGLLQILGIVTVVVALVCILSGWLVSFLNFLEEMKAMKAPKA